MTAAIRNHTSVFLNPLSTSDAAILPQPNAKNAFSILIELLDPKKKASLLDKIGRLENKELHINHVVELANTHNYSFFSDFFLDPAFEYYALAAVQEGKLSAVQFSTLMFIRSTLSEKVKVEDFEIIPLFDREAPSSEAWNYICETLEVYRTPSMTKEELSEFFEIMRKLPISEQCFILIPDTRDLTPPFKNISQSVNENVRFNLFCSIEIKGKKVRMIPSLGMVQAMLAVTGKDGFKIKLILGESTPESLRFSIINDNAREICVHTTIAPAPAMADGFPSPPPDFIYHDIYHAWVAGHIPKSHRKFFCELADVANPDKFSSRASKCAAEDYYISLLDLDIESYRPTHLGRPDPEEASIRAIKFVLDVVVPERRKFLGTKQSRDISIKIRNKLLGLFAVWRLYKPYYNCFEEIIDIFENLDPNLQQQIGTDFLELEHYIECCSPEPITPEELRNLKPYELGKVLQLANINRFALMSLKNAGVPFKEVWGLPPQRRELIVANYCGILGLLQCKIPFQTIIELDSDLLEYMVSGFNYFTILRWYEQGIELKKITEFLRKVLDQKACETLEIFTLNDFIQPEGLLDQFLKLDPAVLRLIINNSSLVRCLTNYGLPLEKVLNYNSSQLKAIFSHAKTAHLGPKILRFLNVEETAKRHQEFRILIEG